MEGMDLQCWRLLPPSCFVLLEAALEAAWGTGGMDQEQD